MVSSSTGGPVPETTSWAEVSIYTSASHKSCLGRLTPRSLLGSGFHVGRSRSASAVYISSLGPSSVQMFVIFVLFIPVSDVKVAIFLSAFSFSSPASVFVSEIPAVIPVI